MASNPDFVQYIVNQCADAGDITVHKMFGDYCIYCNNKPFGLISDNGFYVKPTDTGRKILMTEDMRPPYEGAKPYFYIEDVDDHDYLAALVRATCTELPYPKPKAKKK
ncbi:MAG: TfoX/Sxy family protein [Bacteroidales bacterium]|nr:TfoX/Sxy family protein [Bacteroidales bacterium]